MEKKRVALTGIGVLVGNVKGKEEFWSKIQDGKSDFRVIEEKRDCCTMYRYAGCIDDVEVSGVPPIIIKQTDIATRFAMYGAFMAIDDSQITLDESILKDTGFFFGSELGGLSYGEMGYKNYIDKGYRYLTPYLSIAHFFSAPVGQLSIILKAKGYSKTYCCGECSGSMAIGEAYRTIKDESAKVIISGGYDKANTQTSCQIYDSFGYLSYGKSEDSIAKTKPYSSDSGGMILSDGAGVVILEEYEFAESRGAHIYGEIEAFQQGFSVNNDKEVLKKAIFNALDEANLKPQDICYIHGGALGIPEWDEFEVSAIREIFGNETILGCPAVTFGNTLGSIGSFGLITCVLSMEKNEFYSYEGNEKVSLNNGAPMHSLILTRGLDGHVSVLIAGKV